MKNCALFMVTFAMLAFCPLGRAQDQVPNIDSAIAVLRANMQADRTALITAGMNFNDKDGAAFWPIYQQYEYERSRLDDRRAAVIKQYTQKYPNLTDAEAKAMADQMLDCESRQAELRKKYYKKFNKVLPALTVTKFFQLERRIDLIMDMQVEASLPPLWVTWSNGWSLKDEEENRENLKKVIARCHENGIHVSAYLSATNMFWKSAYRDDPETKKYGLWMHGIPMFYAGPTKTNLQISWKRRLADVREPGWRAYLLKKAELAVDAGVDAIVWDNMIGHNSGLAQLLDDTQRMAERKAQETGRPKVMVYANIHIAPDRFGMNDINEAIWEEDGKDTPGVWDGHWQVGNARKIKFLSGEKEPWQPLMYENDIYHCGHRESCVPSAAEQKLSIAEAYTFGAATSRNIEGRFVSGLIDDEPEAHKAWTAIAQYNHFLVEHQDLYHRTAPAARIALISAEPRNALADEFLKQSVFFETKVLAHLDKGVPLDRFKVLVMPADLPKLSAEQKARLDTFTAGGGVIIRAGKAEPGIASRAEAAAGGPRLSLEPRGYVLGQLTRKPDGRTLILHLLNYDHQVPAENVKVRLELSGLVQDLSRWEVKVVSPDAAEPQFDGRSLHGSVCEFTLGRIDHYTVVTLSARPGP